MSYIVFDLEWNQSPTGKRDEDPTMPFEIIEIGAVRMEFTDGAFTATGTFHEIIRPQLYRTLHFKTREIVHLREESFRGRRIFPSVIDDFFEWCGEDPRFCIWGTLDLVELQRNLQWYDIDSPFPFPLFYYDIQKVFSIVYEDRRTRRSLETAVDMLKIEKDVPFHSAFDDALYTSRVMEHLKEEDLLRNSSIDVFRTPENRREEIRVQYDTYEKFISRPFRSRSATMKDRVVSSTICYKCGKPARKKIRWFSGGRNYFSLSCCEEHGWLKGKARLRQRADGQWYVVKTLRLIGEDEAQTIFSKQLGLRERRRVRRGGGR